MDLQGEAELPVRAFWIVVRKLYSMNNKKRNEGHQRGQDSQIDQIDRKLVHAVVSFMPHKSFQMRQASVGAW